MLCIYLYSSLYMILYRLEIWELRVPKVEKALATVHGQKVLHMLLYALWLIQILCSSWLYQSGTEIICIIQIYWWLGSDLHSNLLYAVIYLFFIHISKWSYFKKNKFFSFLFRIFHPVQELFILKNLRSFILLTLF